VLNLLDFASDSSSKMSIDRDAAELMSLDMILMPMEPSAGSFTGGPFEGPFCNL
jgi:hypothetical protein